MGQLDVLENSNHPKRIETMALYIGNRTKTPDLDIDKLAKWEEIDAQALSMILMNIVPNVQAGLDCSSAKATWDGLTSHYAQVDPIAQNLAQMRLHMKHYIEGGTELCPLTSPNYKS